MRQSGSRELQGFTLLELMIVLLILGLLCSIAAPRVSKYLAKAKTETAKIQITALTAAVESFNLDNGRYPTTAEGLAALMKQPDSLPTWDGPYIDKESSLIDPWKSGYVYRMPGEHRAFDLYTRGADQREGGEGDGRDIGNW